MSRRWLTGHLPAPAAIRRLLGLGGDYGVPDTGNDGTGNDGTGDHGAPDDGASDDRASDDRALDRPTRDGGGIAHGTSGGRRTRRTGSRSGDRWRTAWRDRLERALGDPTLWHATRRSVAGGVATGLFVSWVPLPFQMLLAAVLASALRVHVPVSVVMVWFTNPLTIGPLLYAAWRTGSTLLGTPAPGPLSALGTASLASLLAGLGEVWPTLLAGCLFWALSSAAAGFVATHVLWRAFAVRRWRRRRRASALPRSPRRPPPPPPARPPP